MGWQPELNRGLIASVVFHIGILALVYFGVPNIFAGDIIVEPLGLKAVMLSDITAAPKVDKEGKPTDKPKKQVAEQTKKKEKAPTPEKPKQTASVTPPPPPEERVVALPDQEKPKEEEKPKDKKEPEKPKPETKQKKPPKEDKKKEDEPFDPFKAFNLDPSPTAEPTPEETKKNAQPEPAEPTTGPITPEVSAVPLSATEADSIGNQIGRNWAMDQGALPDPTQYVAWVRVKFDGTGKVLGVEFMEPGRMSDPRYRMVAESCRRAFMITERVDFPKGKEQPVIQFGCDPRYAGF